MPTLVRRKDFVGASWQSVDGAVRCANDAPGPVEKGGTQENEVQCDAGLVRQLSHHVRTERRAVQTDGAWRPRGCP